MKGDFTRNTFDPSKHFSRVLMQQGRVQLDADWNEQAAILLHYLQTLARDLIGPFGGPAEGHGFGLITTEAEIDVLTDASGNPLDEKERNRLKELLPESGFLIGIGRYYVDGLLCENEAYLGYDQQPGYPFLDSEKPEQLDQRTRHLVYLDVWERHLTSLEDDSIREVALGGPDTATRAQVVWQVKIAPITNQASCETIITEEWPTWVNQWQPQNRGQLKALAKPAEDSSATDPCITPPEARYRGAENQLYRVEVHRGGAARSKQARGGGGATFKWSRDNGSVIFALPAQTYFSDPAAGTITLTLEHLGRDSRFGLKEGDWVEIVDDDSVLQGRADPLLQVQKIDRVAMRVTLQGSLEFELNPEKHPMLRRWDHRAGDPNKGGLTLDQGAALIVEDDKKWLTLGDGVQIQFPPASDQTPHQYRTGDYWLIPARTTTGDVEWPGPAGNPEARSPHGVEHHFAPLATILVRSAGEPNGLVVSDCRCIFDKLRCRRDD
jgi:hypothetical protein